MKIFFKVWREKKKVWTEQVSESDSRQVRHMELWDQEFKTINMFSALLDKVDEQTCNINCDGNSTIEPRRNDTDKKFCNKSKECFQ